MILTVSAWEPATASEEKKQRILVGDVPPAVQTTFKQQAGGLAKIIRVEKGKKGGKTVYDAVVSENGKETRIEVGEDGSFLSSHKEETAPARATRSTRISPRSTPALAPTPRGAPNSTPLSGFNSTDKPGTAPRRDTQNSSPAQLKDEDTHSSSDSDVKFPESKKHHHRRLHLRLPFF